MSLPTSDNTVNVTRLGSILSTLWAKIKTALSGKQDKLTSQTAYSEKGTATKVPQITTNSLGQVTGITEVTISGVTPSSHASTATTYGIGTTSTYGHVKLATGDMNGATNTDGVAVSKNHTHSQYAPKASPALTGTPTAPTAADGTNTTQIATTAFVQSAVVQGLSVSDAMVYKGTITLGATSPGGLTVAADKGHTYKVIANGTTTSGYVDGVKVEAGDMVICNTDSTAAATSSNYSTIVAKWDFVQGNTDGVVVGPSSAVSGNVVLFDGATGKLVKDGGTLGTAAFKSVASSGNASSTQVVMGNDTRLTDARIPTSHTHGNISNDGAIASDVAVATDDKLVITDASNSNKIARSNIVFDTTIADTYLSKNGTFSTIKEADIRWGGEFRTYKSPVEAFTCENVWFGPKPSAIFVEYTNNRTSNTPTWIDYGLTNDQKINLFSGNTTSGVMVYCGKALHVHDGYTGSAGGSARVNDLTDSNVADQGLRITVCCRSWTTRDADTDSWVYCQLKRILMRVSTQGASAGVHCVVETMTGSNYKSNSDTWTTRGDYKIQGDSGWNSIPSVLSAFGGGWDQTSQIWAYRFTIWSDTLSSTISSSSSGCVAVISMAALSDNVYVASGSRPSMQRTGTPYSVSGSGKATFGDIQFTARQLAVSLSNTTTNTTFNGNADVTNIKTTGTLPVANGGTGKVSVAADNFLVGNVTGALVEKTPSEVRTLIGAGTSSLTIGTTSTTAAAGNHTHGLRNNMFNKTLPIYDPSDPDASKWLTNFGYENNEGNSTFWLFSIRGNSEIPPWYRRVFAAGIAFGGVDTKGILSVDYDQAHAGFKVAGGNGNAPKWWFNINGTHDKTYTLPSDTCSLQAALPTTGTASTTYAINVTSADSASKLTTARKTYVTLGTASTSTMRDWSGETTIPVDGILNVANGGTGKSSVAANNFLVGNVTGALVEKTPSEVRTLIGAGTSSLTIGTTSTTAAAGDHTHSQYSLTTHSHNLQNSNFTKRVPNYDPDDPDKDTWLKNIGLENRSTGSTYWLVSLRTLADTPPWLAPTYGSGIAFGGEDTKGVMSLRYDIPFIRFAGGSGSAPNWWMTLKGTTGKTYTLPSDTCSLQAALPTIGAPSTSYAINISGKSTYATAFPLATDASTDAGNVSANTLYKVALLDENGNGCWTANPSYSVTANQQRLMYNPDNNTINVSITGDAQSVRGYYITRTIVNDSNAIIFF